MKALTLAAALCLFSSSAFSICRPTNIFAQHKAVVERVANQPKKDILPQSSILSDVKKQAQSGAEETRHVVSMVGKVVTFFLKIIQ